MLVTSSLSQLKYGTFAIIWYVLLYYTYVIVTYGVCTWFDPMVGFEAMQDWLNGGAWNTINYADINNNLQPTQHYLNWWSPGQYMLPYVFIKLLGVRIATAEIITIILCGVISVIGYYKLMQWLRVSTTVSYVVLIMLVCNRNFFWHYLVYFGGETLLWAAAPWLVYVLIKQFNYSYKYMFIAFAIGIVGVFLKTSFVIIYIATAVYLFVSSTIGIAQLLQPKRYKPYVAMVLSVVCVYVFYLSKGATPSTTMDLTMTNGVPNTLLADFVHPWSALVTHFFKIADVLQNIAPALHAKGIDVAWLMLPFVVVSIGVSIYFIRKRTEHTTYLLATIMYVVTASVFMLYYLQNKAVSYETRHYYFVGNVAGIAILQALYTNYKQLFKIVVVLLLLLSTADCSRFTKRANEVHNLYSEYNGIKVETKVLPAMIVITNAITKDSILVLHTDATYTRYLFKLKCTTVCITTNPMNDKQYIQNKYINLDTTTMVTLPINCYNKRTLIVYTNALKNCTLKELQRLYTKPHQYISYYNKLPNYLVAVVSCK